ncbi:peptidoglycan DD-metalloendopeptidase family protein [Streptomyces sp. DH37]|uniref:peptidoglycan DD-metalloendopeptidase family protein n=1 Tax=Streptomyces sp. DH37 TaxID=3040122 RepID=UPI002441E48D|nr:peptidoglycan DD-metalloendopeptidase family protein [Streptomyces sp. DH37]MDG9701658.1 peptidoglycan DD-metalloendopeptidase family protein [Streptomyces sp. DH37]
MAISVGSVEVDVVPNTRGIYSRLRGALVPAATRAGEDAGTAAGRSFSGAMRSEVGTIGLSIGQQIGSQIAARITAEIRGALRDGITQGGRAARPAATRQGNDTGGAFARSLRARLQAAFRSMPRLDVRLSDTGVDADLARLRARLETLSNKTIGVDVDAAAARAEAADIEERLRRIGAAHPNVAVRADTAAAIAQLAAMREEIDRLERDPARVRVETDGTFGQRLRAAVQQAQASLPEVNITADTTPAQIEVMRLRAQLGQLADQRVGIDIDTGTAMARIEAIQARLQVLAASDADVDIRVDTGAAMAQLATVQAMVNRLDGQTANVNINTRGAVRALLHLSIAVAGVAAIPAVPVLAAGIGSIAAAALAAGAGVGALGAAAVPAFLDIKEALEAQKTAQDAAATATAKGGQVAAQAAQRALQLESAQQALASAERNAARQITQAQQQVVQARQNAADVAAQAAQRNQQAARAVQDAERSLVDAQRTARQAQQDLTQARRDAAQQLEDLSSRLANAQLSERDAALAVQEAQARLAATQAAGSRATLLERQRAQLAYDQAVQRLKDQQTETKRLGEEQQEASRAGVDGSDVVRQAQERLATAQRQVADRARAVRDAQTEAARTQVETARQVAQAQQRVSEATANVAVAQQSAAEAVASAQRQVQSAQLSAAGAADQAAVAQAKYQQKLAAMTPATRGTFNAFMALREAFRGWSRELQPHIMPIFTRALDGMRRSLPGLTPFVREAADAIGELQDRASRAFRSEGWAEFKKDLAGSVRPAIIGLGVSLANIGRGVGGILQAFMPHMDSIDGRMRSITGRFADWGTSLKGSPEFEKFLEYSSVTAPKLGEFLRQLGVAFIDVGKALAPISAVLLMVLGGLAEAIGIIADKAPWMIQAIYLAIIAMKLWTIAQWALNLAMSANPITLVVIGIMALVAAVIYAYNRFDWFRTGVQTAWKWIQIAALWTWNAVLKPVFEWIGKIVVWLWTYIIKPYIGFIIAYWKMVGRIAMWLWEAVLSPVFKWIGALIAWWWNNIVKRYFQLVRGAFRGIGWVATWLWEKVIRPVFNFIAGLFRWWWNNIVKRYFGFVRWAIGKLGDAFGWLWEKAVQPVFNWIADKATWLWEKGIRPAFDLIRQGIGKVREGFETAKDGIGKAWDKVGDIAKKPVKFIIETVYNKGIRSVFNKVAGFVGMDKLGEVKLPKGFATGGVLPGYTPGRDVHLAALSGGEAVMRPEWTRAVGPGYVHAMNAAARAGGISGVQRALGLPGFADGGIVDWVTDKAKRVGSAVMSGADFLTSPSKMWDKAVGFIKDRIADIGSSGWAKMLARLPQRMLSVLKDRVLGAATATTGQWVKPVTAAFGTRFGVAGSRWASGRHTGLDFPAAVGAAVRAVADGRVSRARNGGPYGMHVVVDHGGGLQSLYAHLSKIMTKVGARVGAGQRIGSVGATGNVTGPHLHLEARQNGRAIDPMPLLNGAGGPSGGRGVERWRSVVLRALGLVGQPRSLANTTLRRMNQESGGDPRAVNRWDINWQRGHPSVGLMQVIRPTFERHAGQFRGKGPKMYGVSVDPLANIYSSMRYALAQYGGLARAYDRPGGYDSGGWLMPGQLGFNGLSQPEAVLTPQQFRDMSTLAARGAETVSGLQPGDRLALRVADREFDAYVEELAEGRVQAGFARARRRLQAGVKQ